MSPRLALCLALFAGACASSPGAPIADPEPAPAPGPVVAQPQPAALAQPTAPASAAVPLRKQAVVDAELRRLFEVGGMEAAALVAAHAPGCTCGLPTVPLWKSRPAEGAGEPQALSPDEMKQQALGMSQDFLEALRSKHPPMVLAETGSAESPPVVRFTALAPLLPGAKLAVLRDGREVARLEVLSVEADLATCARAASDPSPPLLATDQVRLVRADP